MADPTPEVTLADLVVAQNVGLKVDHLLKEASLLSMSLNTTITVPQVLAAVLISAADVSDRLLTRDEFIGVYDYVAGRLAEQEAQEARVAASTGPEDVANAESREEAAALADVWGARIDSIAFEVPEFPAD